MTSFKLNHHVKDPISKYSHVLRYWVLGLQYMHEFWGKHNLAHKRNMGMRQEKNLDEFLENKIQWETTSG